jgi:methylated-DNA-[protein]-cysteine S-methyltransferase
MLYSKIEPSPIGPLRLVGDGSALTALWLPGSWKAHEVDQDGASDAVLKEAAQQLQAYFAGTLQRFELPLAPHGTPFQQRVWQALLRIPYGRTSSYREIADVIDEPGKARAVGAANGQNPIAIIIPCHRVIGSHGELVGYGGGLERKRWLLELESGAATLPLFQATSSGVARDWG